jgi:hypothetical protein
MTVEGTRPTIDTLSDSISPISPIGEEMPPTRSTVTDPFEPTKCLPWAHPTDWVLRKKPMQQCVYCKYHQISMSCQTGVI